MATTTPQTVTKAPPTTDSAFLLIQEEARRVAQQYKDDPRQDSVNVLLLGETGSGKSHFATTCRRPIHMDVFDPGGIKHLKPEIEKGWIIPDTSWEGDDPFSPDRYMKWKATMEKRLKMGYFNHMGTCFLDSATMWSASIMNDILKKDGRAGTPPKFTHDYAPQKVEIVNWIKRLMKLPCDFILTGHLEGQKDDVTGAISYRFMTTGKGDVIIPLEFDEIWVADTVKKSSGVEYRIITQRTGPYLAATRLGRGKFDIYEKPDMEYLMKKAGRKFEHKPLLTT